MEISHLNIIAQPYGTQQSKTIAVDNNVNNNIHIDSIHNLHHFKRILKKHYLHSYSLCLTISIMTHMLTSLQHFFVFLFFGFSFCFCFCFFVLQQFQLP